MSYFSSLILNFPSFVSPVLRFVLPERINRSFGADRHPWRFLGNHWKVGSCAVSRALGMITCSSRGMQATRTKQQLMFVTLDCVRLQSDHNASRACDHDALRHFMMKRSARVLSRTRKASHSFFYSFWKWYSWETGEKIRDSTAQQSLSVDRPVLVRYIQLGRNILGRFDVNGDNTLFCKQ